MVPWQNRVPCIQFFLIHFTLHLGSILKRDYSLGDMIEEDGPLNKKKQGIVQVDIETFEEKYGDYLNQEQLAREFYLSTGTITSWVTKGKISPDEMITFGSRKIYLFAPEHVKQIREENNIPEHTEGNDQNGLLLILWKNVITVFLTRCRFFFHS